MYKIKEIVYHYLALANKFSNSGGFKQALKIEMTALHICRQEYGNSFHELTATCLNNIALNFHILGRSDVGLKYALLSLEMYRNVHNEDNINVAMSLNNAALCYSSCGNHVKGHEYIITSLKIIQNLNSEDNIQLATAIDNAAASFHEIGDYNHAVEYRLKALNIRKNILGEFHPDTARSIDGLGSDYQAIGNLEKAYFLKKEALEIREKSFIGENIEIARSLNNFAAICLSLYRKDEALGLNLKALKILKNLFGDQHPMVALNINNIGGIYHSSGNNKEALKFFINALSIYKKIYKDINSEIAACYLNIASVYNDMGESEKAIFFQIKSVSAFKDLFSEDNPKYALSLNNLGNFMMLNGNYFSAIMNYSKSLSIYNRLFTEPCKDLLLINSNIGVYYAFRKKNEISFKYFLKSLQIRWSMDCQNLFGLTDIEGKLLATDFSSVFMNSLLTLLSEKNINREDYIKETYSLIVQRRCLESELHGAVQTVILTNRYPEKNILINALIKARAEVSRWAQQLQNSPSQSTYSDVRQQLKYWENEESSLLTQLNDIPEIRGQVSRRSFSAQNFKGKLPEKSILLELILYNRMEFRPKKQTDGGKLYYGQAEEQEKRYGAFVFYASETPPLFLDLGEADGIDAALLGYLDENDNGSVGRSDEEEEVVDLPLDENPPPSSVRTRREAFLQHSFWKPLYDIIGTPSRLFIAPDGELNFAPFHRIFPDAETIEYLVTGGDLTFSDDRPDATSARALLLADPHYGLTNTVGLGKLTGIPVRQKNMVTKDATIIAGKRGVDRAVQNMRRLPGTRLEVARLAKRLNVDALFWDKATVSTIESCPAPRLLYIATHFAISREVSKNDNLFHQCGIVLAGARSRARGRGVPIEAQPSILTAYDITRLDLRGTMVILSACSAARGAIEPGRMVRGLRSALLWAGARTLVMPLWKVDDLATAIFMNHFTANLFKPGTSINEALASAQNFLQFATVASLRIEWFNDTTDTELKTIENESRDLEDREPVTALRARLHEIRKLPDVMRPFADERYWAAFVVIGDTSPFVMTHM